jgi:hypothetical protein
MENGMRDRKRVLAVASGGGHWVQLYRLRPAWDGCDVTYVTTDEQLGPQLSEDAARRNQRPPKLIVVKDANRWQRMQLLLTLFSIAVTVLRLRPDIIVTTGAAPGYFAIRIGRLIGCRTVWIDSIANVEAVSMSGSMAGQYCDLWLTQWRHLESPRGPWFKGRVI